MEKITREQLGELRKKLPQDVRDIYSSEDTTSILEEIGKKHNVHLDELGELVSETGYVLVGVTPPSEFIENLVKRMGIEKEKARAIAHDVNEQVFRPIRESLKKIHSLEQEKRDSKEGTPQKQNVFKVLKPQRKDVGIQPETQQKEVSQETKPMEAPLITPQKKSTPDPMGEEDPEEEVKMRIFGEPKKEEKKEFQGNIFKPTQKTQEKSQEISPAGLALETTKKEGRDREQEKVPQKETPRAVSEIHPQTKITPGPQKVMGAEQNTQKQEQKKHYEVDPYREPID